MCQGSAVSAQNLVRRLCVNSTSLKVCHVSVVSAQNLVRRPTQLDKLFSSVAVHGQLEIITPHLVLRRCIVVK